MGIKSVLLKVLVIGIMIGTLVYFFIRLDQKGELKTVWELMFSANTMFIGGALFCMLFSMVFKAFRYFVLIHHSAPSITFRQFLAPFFVGYGFSVLGPFKVGEVVSVEVNKQALNIPRTASVAALAVFRTYDLIITILFFFIGIWKTVAHIVGEDYQNLITILFFVVVILTTVFMIILFFPPFGWLIKRITVSIFKVISMKFAIKMDNVIDSTLKNYYSSLKFVFQRKRPALYALFLSLSRWLIEFLAFNLILHALDISISYIDSATIVSITLYVSLLTFAPAGIGTGTLTTQFLLEASGVPTNIAGAIVILNTIMGAGLIAILATISTLFVRKKKEEDTVTEKHKNIVEHIHH